MDDGVDKEGDELSTPSEFLASISTEFKDILMDIHSSIKDPIADIGGLDSIETSMQESGLSVGNQNFDGNDVEMSDIVNNGEGGGGGRNGTTELSKDVLSSGEGGLWGESSTGGADIPGIDGLFPSLSDDKHEVIVIDDEVQQTSSTGTTGVQVLDKVKVVQNNLPGGTFKLFVAGFPSYFTSADLTKIFGDKFGKIVECEVFKAKNYGFVHLDTEKGGNEAIKQLNGTTIDGCVLGVKKSKQVTGPRNPYFFGQEQNIEIGTFKLYISNLEAGVTKESVTELIEPYGRIVEIEIYRSNAAFVHLEEEEAAKKVINELNGKYYKKSGRTLSVSESKNPEGPRTPSIMLQVTNVSSQASAELIRSLFQPYGLVLKCSFHYSKFDLLTKAIVHLEQLGDIRSAIKDLNGYELDGYKLKVEPCFQEKEKTFPTKREYSSKPLLPDPMSNKRYNTPLQRPPIPPSLPLMMERGGRGRGGFAVRPAKRNWQLVPMPSSSDASGVMRAVGRGRGQRGRPSHRMGTPQQYFDEYGNATDFVQDSFDFDEYYGDPMAATARNHYTPADEEFDQYDYEQPERILRDPGLKGFNEQKEYPPTKRPCDRLTYMPQSSNIPSLMMDYDYSIQETEEFEGEEEQVSYNPHAYQSLNLPLGEREYYSPENKKVPSLMQGRSQKFDPFRNQTQQQPQPFEQANNSRLIQQHNQLRRGQQQQQQHLAQQEQQRRAQQQNQRQTQQEQQRWAQQEQQRNPVQAQQEQLNKLRQTQQKQWQKQNAQAQNYLVPEQIPSTNANNDNSDFEFSTAYPASYYTGVEDFNSTGGNWSRFKETTQSGQVAAQTGLISRPGGKMYYNQDGVLKIRGNRGGINRKKARCPGLGSRPVNNSNSTSIEANEEPVNSNPTPNRFFGQGAGGGGFRKFKTKEQAKEENNQEYVDWLKQKPWLHTPISGTIKPAKL